MVQDCGTSHSCQYLLEMVVCSQTWYPYTVQAACVSLIIQMVSSLHQPPLVLVSVLLFFLLRLRLLVHKFFSYIHISCSNRTILDNVALEHDFKCFQCRLSIHSSSCLCFINNSDGIITSSATTGFGVCLVVFPLRL